jgi:quercetin dioxygenase-like cupin family protein
MSKEQEMKHKPVGPTEKGPSERFTGDVYATRIVTPEESLGLSAGIVRFTPGSRTNWHVHPTGQALHVLDGIALVGTRGGITVRAQAGETVLCPPGVDHWHGATPDTLMVHLAVVATITDGTTWFEPVTREEYQAATKH